MTVLVTGAAGYLGRQVVRQLVDRSEAVVALCRRDKGGLDSRVGIVCADLCDEDSLDKVFRTHRPDSVIHCAAAIPRAISAAEEARSEVDNLTATKNLLAVASRHDVGRIVFASTISVYTGPAGVQVGEFTEANEPCPEGFYGRHKLAGEALCEEWCTGGADRSGVVLRFAGLHGTPRQSGVVYAFVSRALAERPISVSAPQSRYSLLNVDDAAAATILALGVPEGPGFWKFNIAGSEPCDLGALAEKVRSLCGSESAIEVGDEDPRFAVMAIDAAREVLGFRPTPLEEWLRREIEEISNSR